MANLAVLTESDLRRAVGLGQAELAAIEAIYPLISAGAGSMPPIMRIDVPEHNGEVDIKSAYLPGYPGIAVKLSAGFFDNPTKGLPSLGGLMILLDTETGVPRAALFDNGYLTDLRTGLAGAVAAKHLARQDATTAAVFGAGIQAALQLEALSLVRNIDRGLVWARRRDQATDFAARMSDRLGYPVSATDRERAAAEADILVTATPASEPLVGAALLHEGIHVTAVGSDAEHKQELAAEILAIADVFAVDKREQSERLGELRAALAAGHSDRAVVELGEIIAGTRQGRMAARDVTVVDLTGTGAQDTAIAGLAVEQCRDLGLGVEIET